MPRRVVLHIGFHKTGTTSVQAFLRANRKVLQPKAAIRLRGMMEPVVLAARGFSTWRDPISLAKVSFRFDALLRSLPSMPRRVLILSAEELSGHMPGRGAQGDYSAAVALVQTYVAAIKRLFPKAEVIIYAGIRDPERWLRSAYWQHVKSSSMTMDYDSFVQAYPNAADLVGVLGQVQDAVDVPVFYRPLEAFRDEPLGPASGLLEHCDLPAHLLRRLTPVPPANTRLPEPVLLDMLEANRTHKDSDARKAAKQSILVAAGLG